MTPEESDSVGIVEFAHVQGTVGATRMRVEAEIFLAALESGNARLLEVAGLYDNGVTTLWQTFVEPGFHQLPITHVAVVAPRHAHERIEQSAQRFHHLQIRVFSGLEPARDWLRGAT